MYSRSSSPLLRKVAYFFTSITQTFSPLDKLRSGLGSDSWYPSCVFLCSACNVWVFRGLHLCAHIVESSLATREILSLTPTVWTGLELQLHGDRASWDDSPRKTDIVCQAICLDLQHMGQQPVTTDSFTDDTINSGVVLLQTGPSQGVEAQSLYGGGKLYIAGNYRQSSSE